MVTDLRRLRQHLGMTQRQLADAIGVHRHTINLHERGKTPVPRERMLAVLCLCLWATMQPPTEEERKAAQASALKILARR